jgi:uncharacterized membrane protein YeaQ/YmgE (transglycosylase-associated protein family)
MQFLVALFVGIPVGVWIYSRMMRSSGSDAKGSLIVSGIVGAFAFLVVYMLARTFLN